MVLRVLRPSSIVRRRASGVVCAEHNSHNIEDNKPLLYTYICYVCRLCAKNIVAPPIKLNSGLAKVVFNILIFFSETTSRWRLILCHYIPGCWTIIVCSKNCLDKFRIKTYYTCISISYRVNQTYFYCQYNQTHQMC